jgi:hypothetical protein
MRRALVIFVFSVATVLWPGMAAHGSPALRKDVASPTAPTLRADFNDDGAEDLAVAAPFESVGAAESAGTVFVLFGTSGGLVGPGSQLINQASPGIASEPESGDVFGFALAAGDFNDDDVTDLAIGAPGESVGTVPSAGSVQILYGSPGGLSTVGSQLFTQDSPGVASTAEVADQFGYALAAGDFNGDGADDLAAGAPSEHVGPIDGAGAVNVLYGAAPAGLTGIGSGLFTQAGPSVHSEPELFDRFGAALAAGDFDLDSFDDLAVGVPGESAGLVERAGAVNVFSGSVADLTVTGSVIFTQDVEGVGSAAEPFDQFGSALAAADFNGDDHDDLAIGVPDEDVGAIDGAGSINVLPGSPTGLRGIGSQLFNQQSPGIISDAEPLDEFGSALAAGNFDGDADDTDDLAIGVPFESVGSVPEAGAVNVLYGALANGLSGIGSQLFAQDTPGIGSTSEVADEFGAALGAGDFDGDDITDLAVGAPFETVGSVQSAGAMNTLSGSTAGLTATGSQLFTQDSPGIGSTVEIFDLFGQRLAATTPAPS